MDLINGLRTIREMSRDSMDRTNQFLTGGGFGDNAGKPADYGITGAGWNNKLTPAVGTRMAGTGLANAVINAGAQHLIEPVRAAIQPHFNGAIAEITGVTPTPNVARLPQFK